ncbi:MAG: metal-dependent transcriptional regulator [Anaerolineae bacterium]|nr:metal-dependent transcriptional regulator [Anaerolineae bacterium]
MSHSSHARSTDRPTHTVEDYLMTMHVMERDFGEIVAARLAEMLSVSPATVAMTLRRMERDNWITGRGRKSIHLTETGRAAAHSVIRRHMLTEWLLVRLLKVPIDQTHDEAHGIEHAISPQLEARLRDALDDPKVCPHGNPFPGCEEYTRAWRPLTELSPGQTVTLRRIHEFAEDNHELLTFLSENGIAPGVSVEILEILPFNQTVSIRLAGRQITLGFSAARFIFAETPQTP